MVEFRVFGALSLTTDDGRDARSLVAQPRRLALLAYLAAATPRGTHRRDSLLALFWPEFDQPRARAALRQSLYVLREVLGPAALVNQGNEEVGLDFGAVRCDVVDFNRSIESGHLSEALDLYGGHLLEGFFISDAPEFEHWLETERARLQAAASAAARTLVEQCEGGGDLTAAAQWARRAARLAPLDESLLRRLIGLLDRLGDRAGAVMAYEDFAKRLAQEYETRPAAETQALMTAVRARERAAGTVRLPRVELLPRLQAALADRYRVERELARGRTATVCLAHDLKHDRPVAVKVLHPELAAVVGAERFLREIQIAARLRHPQIVPLHDSGEADGLLYFVMPYVDGESLRDRLKREPQLPVADAVRIAVDVAGALDYAHGLGLVHRDIKPENILLEGGHAMVADLGIARAVSTAGSDKLTETGIAIGTPAYMSPEQGTEGGHVDGRSDLYALACVLYEMLTGAPPFTGPTAQAVLARHAVDPVAPIRTVRHTVPWGVERAVLQALAKVPTDRYRGVAEFADALATPSAEPTPGGSGLGRRAVKIALGTAASIVATLTLLVGVNAGGWRDRLWAKPDAGRIRSLAVRPLADLSRDTLHSWFADGMTEALITDLGRISALRVTSRGAVLQFKDTASFRNMVRELHVDAVVEGGVQRSGDRVRVDVRLIDAASGYQLWADRFEENDRNRFALEDRVRRGILAALKVPVTASEERSLGTPPTSSPEAYDLYLRGKLEARTVTPAHLAVAIALLERAVALDPGFATAYAELAHAYGHKVLGLTPRDTMAWERALVAAEKALRLRPDLAEAHYARAYLLWSPAYRFPHVLAIREYRRALALNPNLEDAHHQLGLVYLHIGFFDGAIDEFQKALAIDPTDRIVEQRIGVALVHQGKYEEALRIFRQIPSDKNPALWHYHVAWAMLHLHQDSEASALIEQYLHQHPEDPGGLLTSARAFLRAKLGDVRGAEADIHGAEEIGAGYIHFHHTASRIASAYALLGRPGPAVAWLRRAAEDGLPCYPCFATDPDLDSIRHDPGFIAFMQDLRTQWGRYRAAVAAHG